MNGARVARAALAVAVAVTFAGCAAVDTAPRLFARQSSAGLVPVEKVTDGDTITAGGMKVRILVIDSCEMSTPGGKAAKEEARRLLEGQQVRLVKEAGVDTDRYGRHLRYVELDDGRDFGEVMVGYDHTGVYGKKSDASVERVERAKLLDDGRDCG